MELQFAILILISNLITCSQSGFTLFPTPQVVPSAAEEAIFYCRYPAARSIGWRVDGNVLGRMPLVGITPCTDPRLDGVVIDRLKVEVDPAYTHDGITIECVAYFIGRPVEISEPANLTIQADATFKMGFVVTPYSQYPNTTEIVLAAGKEGVFECQYCVAEDIYWIINGVILDELNLSGNTTTIVRNYTVRPYCGALHMLRISNISNYNSSTIQCGPEEGSSDEVSEVVTLWVQGATLNPIQSIRKTAYDTYSVYEWNIPFSLDLTGIDPDIVYCVTVYEILCLNQNLRLKDSNCNISYPNYTTPFGNLNSAKRFEIAVSPKLNSVNILNTTMPIKYEDQFIHLDTNAVTFNTTIIPTSSESPTTQLSGKLNLEATDPLDIRPEDYAMELRTPSIESENQGDAEKCPMLIDYSKFKADATISWTLNCSSPIQTKRLFLCYIYAFVMKSECYIPISSAIELSTHVIQNVTVSSTIHHGELVVHADFIQTISITSLGYMAVVYSNHSDIHYKVACRQYNQSNAAVNFSGLPGNSYRVSVFNIEPDGVPSTNSASLSKNKSIVGDTDVQQVIGETDKSLHIEYMHGPDNCCIRCVFFNDSIEFCLLVTIKRSQLAIDESKYGLLNIHTREVQNNTKEFIYNCTEYIIRAFGYRSDFGMIIGSGVDVSFANDSELSLLDSDSDEQQLSIASSTIAVAVTVVSAIIILSSFALVVIIILILIRKKRNLKVDSSQISVVVRSHPGNDDTEELINTMETF